MAEAPMMFIFRSNCACKCADIKGSGLKQYSNGCARSQLFPGFNGSAVIFAALTVILVNAVKMLSRLKGFFFLFL